MARDLREILNKRRRSPPKICESTFQDRDFRQQVGHVSQHEDRRFHSDRSERRDHPRPRRQERRGRRSPPRPRDVRVRREEFNEMVVVDEVNDDESLDLSLSPDPESKENVDGNERRRSTPDDDRKRRKFSPKPRSPRVPSPAPRSPRLASPSPRSPRRRRFASRSPPPRSPKIASSRSPRPISRCSSSSLSLSLSASPPPPRPESPIPRPAPRVESPIAKRRRHSSHRSSPPRRRRSRSSSRSRSRSGRLSSRRNSHRSHRSRSPNHRRSRSRSHSRRRSRSRSHRRSRSPSRPRSRSSSLRSSLPTDSWESKVAAFMHRIEGPSTKHYDFPDVSHPPPPISAFTPITPSPPPEPSTSHQRTSPPAKKSPQKPQIPGKDPPPPGVDPNDEDPDDDLKATALVRYIGKKLTTNKKGDKLKKLNLKMEGVFEPNLLSLLNRGEWVAAKTLKLLEEAGYSEDKLYMLATTRGGPALETELKTAIFTGKLKQIKPQLVQQVLRVVEFVVKYYTSGQDSSEDEEEEEEEADTKESGNPLRMGMADVLKQLSDEKGQEVPEEKADPIPQQAPMNPWTFMSDAIQANHLRSFGDMKTFIFKNLLRDQHKLRLAKVTLETAEDMVMGWVINDMNLDSLRQLVMQTPTEDILPPRETMNDLQAEKQGLSMKRYLYHDLVDRLKRMRNSLSPDLTDQLIEYCVSKSLLYVMRGCDKLPVPAKTPAGTNIVFNYLPPGLRDSEKKSGQQDQSDLGQYVPEGDPNEITVIENDNGPPKVLDRTSTDPLHAILDPGISAPKAKPNELPNRKYMIGSVHIEWVVLKGKPQIYEISVYMSDMTSLNLYVVTKTLMGQQDTLENLGFVANPDRHEYYFVQVGIGCVRALLLDKAFEKLGQFLEEKRNSTTSENRNNGLVLLFNSQDELAIVLRALEKTKQNDLLLNTVKGFGCLEHYIDRNRSKKLMFMGPKLNVGGDECFFNTEVRKGLATANLVTKSKGESLYQAVELFLDSSPNFKNFIHPYCFPCFCPTVDKLKKRLSQIEEMYPLIVFIALNLRDQGATLFLEGVFQPNIGKDLRDKATVVASRFCQTLVEAGFDKATLDKCFRKDKSFTLNSSVVLDKMSNMPQRLKVMDQTVRCIRLLQMYFTTR